MKGGKNTEEYKISSHREIQNEVERQGNSDQDDARQKGLPMKTIGTYIFAILIPLFSASACAAFQAGTDVESGRRAFLVGDNETALGYFQGAAQIDPDYVYYGMGLRENIWSYVG